MRILVCGDRHWTDYEMVLGVLVKLRPAVVIEGGCQGADACAKLAAGLLRIDTLSFPADWRTQGKAAGPIRNQRMLDVGKPDLVVAFHDDLGRSKGTNDMLSRAELANIPTRLINHRQPAAIDREIRHG
jgi:hypothetical protein